MPGRRLAGRIEEDGERDGRRDRGAPGMEPVGESRDPGRAAAKAAGWRAAGVRVHRARGESLPHGFDGGLEIEDDSSAAPPRGPDALGEGAEDGGVGGVDPAAVGVGEHRPDRGAEPGVGEARGGHPRVASTVSGQTARMGSIAWRRRSATVPLAASVAAGTVSHQMRRRGRRRGRVYHALPWGAPRRYAAGMKILYGVVGEGMGHAMRSRVVLEHLVGQGHEMRSWPRVGRPIFSPSTSRG